MSAQKLAIGSQLVIWLASFIMVFATILTPENRLPQQLFFSLTLAIVGASSLTTVLLMHFGLCASSPETEQPSQPYRPTRAKHVEGNSYLCYQEGDDPDKGMRVRVFPPGVLRKLREAKGSHPEPPPTEKEST